MDDRVTDEDGDALLAALEADMDEDEPADEPATVRDVRSVLEEIGAEEAIAHLDARVAGIEQELERRDVRQRDAERTRRGEFDLMRARIDDALELVRSSMEEQRETWSRFENRFVALVAEADETAQAHIGELREELTPRVQDALVRLDEATARLRGEVHAATQVGQERVQATVEAMADLRERVDGQLGELGARADREQQARTQATGRLEQLVEQRLSQLEASTETVATDLRERLDGMRRELDSAVGELRAALSLRGSELADRLEEVEEGMSERLEAEVNGLEQRWIEGTRDIARRIEQTQRDLQEELAAERESRRAGDDGSAARLDEVAAVVEELHAANGADGARRHAQDEQLRQELDGLASRLDVLQSKVASAVGQIASELTNRVATLGAEQSALREASVRRDERLAGVDALESRIDDLSRELAAQARRQPGAGEGEHREEVDRSVTAVRNELAGVSGTVEAANARLRELGASVERLREEAEERAALRHEVRELTARNAELAERLVETERLARAAGKAIASAVRRSRSAQQQRDGGETLFFRPDAPTPPPEG